MVNLVLLRAVLTGPKNSSFITIFSLNFGSAKIRDFEGKVELEWSALNSQVGYSLYSDDSPG